MARCRSHGMRQLRRRAIRRMRRGASWRWLLAGEAKLEERLKRRQRLELAVLRSGACARYDAEWSAIEEQFNRQPAMPVHAQALVAGALAERGYAIERGYAMESFEQRAADLFVDYPDKRKRSEMQKLLTFSLIVAVVAAVVAPARAAASSTYSDTLSGYEYWASSSEGKFAGTASGSLPGSWNADVQHTALCLSCEPTATITGGSFSLSTVIDYLPTLVTGRFTGGTVQVINSGTNCTNQTFVVNGVLSNVGAWWSGSGSGAFAVTLTHYRHYVFGSCVTYGASVAGTLSVTL